MFCKSTEYKTGKKTKSMCPNVFGKYQNYLSDIGKQNPKVADYAKWVYASGDFSPIQILNPKISKNKKYFNLNDPNIQLILAIHYLSLNDLSKRNENWNVE